MKDLILFMGQSNMQGSSGSCSETAEVEGAVEYRYLTDSLTPLKNPVGENFKYDMERALNSDSSEFAAKSEDAILLAPDDNCTTMLPEFARSYIKKTNHEIVAVHAARGATNAAYWQPGTDGYRSVVTKASGAVHKIGKENIGKIYVVWLQGESDMLEATPKDEYIKKIVNIRDGLSKDIGIDAFGIVRVGNFSSVVDWWHGDLETRKQNDKTIQEAQDILCRDYPGFIMLTTITEKLVYDGSDYMNLQAMGHYNALGLETIGKYAGKHFGAFAIGEDFDPNEANL